MNREILPPPIELTLDRKNRKALSAYHRQPNNPEVITNLWQTIIDSSVEACVRRAEQEKRNFEQPSVTVPSCELSNKELRGLKRKGLGVIYNPGFSYPVLGKLFPSLNDHCLDKNSEIAKEEQEPGWFSVETAVVSPYLDLTEPQIREIFQSQKRDFQRLSTYIWASQVSRLTTGHYLDESSWSRVKASKDIICTAGTLPRARIGVMLRPYPLLHFPNLGARSEAKIALID